MKKGRNVDSGEERRWGWGSIDSLNRLYNNAVSSRQIATVNCKVLPYPAMLGGFLAWRQAKFLFLPFNSHPIDPCLIYRHLCCMFWGPSMNDGGLSILEKIALQVKGEILGTEISSDVLTFASVKPNKVTEIHSWRRIHPMHPNPTLACLCTVHLWNN
jgi:hypothetical protein